MLKVFNKIALGIFLCAVPFLFYGFGKVVLQTLAKTSLGNSRWLAFFAGAAIFFPIYFVAKKLFYSIWCYLETLEHELTHLIIGLLFLKIPTGIRVSAHEGGEVRQIGFGTTGQVWVTLAPYFFPTVSVAVVIVTYFLKTNALTLLAVLGWTTAFHLISNWGETSFRQPDLQKAGTMKTILILPVMNLICYGAILAFVADGNRGFGSFWISGFRETLSALTVIWKI